MNTPFFSVVIPAYNRALLLPKTIESVSNQTFTNYEIIIVDDGSKDNTKEVVENLKNPKVRYIYQNNAERSAARNNGAKNALGIYVCFLDSDDYYLENHLEVLYTEIQKNNFDKAMYFVNTKHLQNNLITIPDSKPLTKEPLIYFLSNPIIPTRVCLHRDIFNDCQFDIDVIIVEDTMMWCNVSKKYAIHHIEQNTVLYHLHDDNSVLLKYNSFAHRLKGLRKLFAEEYFKKNIPERLRTLLISDCYFGIARHYDFVGKFFPMLINLVRSIWVYPNWQVSKKKIYMIYTFLRK